MAEHTPSDDAKEHWRNGNKLFEDSNFEEALVEYGKAIESDSEYPDAYFNRALTERITHDYDAARRDLERVIELQPDSADALLLIGDIAEMNKDLLGARFWYEKSLAANPDYTEAKTRLEHIDSILHPSKPASPGKTGEKQIQIEQLKPVKPAEQQKEVIEEGQIKKLAFYKSNVKFDRVIGLERVKRYLYENVVLAIQRPELFQKYGKKMGIGLLLYGPPGVGKSYIVNAIAGEANANVIVARINQIVDMYTGNTEKNLHAVFEQARQNAPCLVLFDEVDALGGKRNSGGTGENSAMRLAVNQFLVEMNGVEANPEGIFVMGTTNQPWDMDPALKRSGRFGDSVYIPPPKYGDRKKLFELYTRNTPRGRLSYGRLSRATAGYSPADIERICDKAKMRPLLHEYTRAQGRKLTMGDMMAVLKDPDQNSGSSLDEWYLMVKKDVISKTETQIVDGKKQVIEKEGKLDAEEKLLYKTMIKDIKKNTKRLRVRSKKMQRWWALHVW
ncbi:MAG: AAA family ATPase [Candidatus Marsarchaeota archaeon]|nr:AAA family ATPase [Candidatus Marsarchaeota archaeon]